MRGKTKKFLRSRGWISVKVATSYSNRKKSKVMWYHISDPSRKKYGIKYVISTENRKDSVAIRIAEFILENLNKSEDRYYRFVGKDEFWVSTPRGVVHISFCLKDSYIEVSCGTSNALKYGSEGLPIGRNQFYYSDPKFPNNMLEHVISLNENRNV